MPVERGKQVKVRYTGTLEDGTVFDSNEDGELLSFVVGSGQIIKGFDSAVVGMEIGDEKTITLQPEDAYGQPDPRLILKVPLSRFPKDAKLEIGQYLSLSSPDGDHVEARVEAIKKNEVTINLNAPLAGKVLNFKIKVEDFGEPDPNQCGCGCEHDDCCHDAHDHDDCGCDECGQDDNEDVL